MEISSTKDKKQTAYKDTPIGKIPADWEVKRLKNVGKLITGSTPSTNNSEYYGDEYLFISPIDLGEEKYVVNSVKKLSKFGLSVCRKIPENSILFTCIGSTIGKIGISKFELATNQQINSIVPFENYDFEYLYYQLEFEAIKIKLLAGEQAVPIINKSEFENIILRIAPLPEQQRIAEVLSTWDQAIQCTEQLIRQKEQRKKWLMQKLLTGKIRLKGFSGEAQYKILGKFIVEVSERNRNGYVKNVLSVTNSRGFINQAEQFDREVASADVSNYKIVRKGQFAYNPSRVNVGSLDLLRKFDIGILSPMYVVFETDRKKLMPEYLYYLLRTYWFYGHIPMFVQGSVRNSLSFDGLCGMKFFIPSLQEQTAIAEILQAADKEIELLKAKAEKLKEQKKGLMQQLLTGRKRLESY